MATSTLDSLTDNQKLKLTVLCDVRKICQEVGSLKDQVIFNKESVELISEMVWRKVHDFGFDLELFARHAKRSTINPEDVKLLVRKNERLKERVVKMCDELTIAAPKRRKKDKDVENAQEDSKEDTAVIGDDIGNFDLDIIDLVDV